MKNSLRVVTRMPLTNLWRNDDSSITLRGRPLSRTEIVGLLRATPVEFVIADPGQPLRWITLTDCYTFWKNEVMPHLSEPGKKWAFDDYPNAYCYLATQWSDPSQAAPVVLLERHH